MQIVDTDAIARDLPRLQTEWRNAADTCGASIVVMDALLSPAARDIVFDSVPDRTWAEWENVADRLQAAKWSTARIERFPPPLATLLHELNSGPVVRLLEELTGIRGLLPDPHLWGGGLHVTRPGGYLWPHTDFPSDRQLGLKRVLNLLCYVHRHWTPEMGGHFQLWRNGSVARSVAPLPGRCLVFQTDETSVHGVSRVDGTEDRQSVALFYYTLQNVPPHSTDTTTGWQLRTTPSGVVLSPIRRGVAAGFMRLSLLSKRLSIVLNQRAEYVMNAGMTKPPDI